MSNIWKKFKKDVQGIAWLLLTLFLTLALASFSPKDPSFNSMATDTQDVINWCGLVGSFLADLMYQLLGLGAWVLPLMTLRRVYIAFRGRSESGRAASALLSLVLAVTVSSLLGLYFWEKKIFLEQIWLGGFIGTFLARGARAALNIGGASILFWGIFAISWICLTEKNLSDWGRLPGRLWKQMVARIAMALEERRERRGAKRAEQQKAASTDQLLGASQPAARFEFAVHPVDNSEEKGSEAQPSASFKAVLPKRKLKMAAPVRQVENWNLPELSLLSDPPSSRHRVDNKEIERKSEILINKLSQFDVDGEIRAVRPGPAVTMFEFKPNADVKISKITELADDLSLALSSESVRIIAPIPGRDVVGIETSNAHRETVYLKDILSNDDFWSDKWKLPLALGRQADGESKVVDLRKMPHLMVAGTTGSGKSVFVVSILTGLLFRHSPKTLRLILIDPKQVDLAIFQNVPHLLLPAVRDPKKAVSSLKWAIREMDKRYRSMSRFGARNLEDFNQSVAKLERAQLEEHEKINNDLEIANHRNEQYYFAEQPYIVIVIEEFGDLMTVDKVNVEQLVVRLAQMARACGIHMILAMQSPRKEVVTGLIKTNIPGRISFKVASKMDSRIILDDAGAERLLATGDMLFLAPGVSKPLRHHGSWVPEAEIMAVIKFWAEQGSPQFDAAALKAVDTNEAEDDLEASSPLDMDDAEQDEMYDQVLAYVSTLKEVSASLLQRRFRLGYPRAARLVEIFEREGVVGPSNGSKPRLVLIKSYDAPSP